MKTCRVEPAGCVAHSHDAQAASPRGAGASPGRLARHRIRRPAAQRGPGRRRRAPHAGARVARRQPRGCDIASARRRAGQRRGRRAAAADNRRARAIAAPDGCLATASAARRVVSGDHRPRFDPRALSPADAGGQAVAVGREAARERRRALHGAAPVDTPGGR
eukprot:5749080-Prymnesium_polylepis.1